MLGSNYSITYSTRQIWHLATSILYEWNEWIFVSRNKRILNNTHIFRWWGCRMHSKWLAGTAGRTIVVQQNLRFAETLDQVHISCRRLLWKLTNYCLHNAVVSVVKLWTFWTSLVLQSTQWLSMNAYQLVTAEPSLFLVLHGYNCHAANIMRRLVSRLNPRFSPVLFRILLYPSTRL